MDRYQLYIDETSIQQTRALFTTNLELLSVDLTTLPQSDNHSLDSSYQEVLRIIENLLGNNEKKMDFGLHIIPRWVAHKATSAEKQAYLQEIGYGNTNVLKCLKVQMLF